MTNDTARSQIPAEEHLRAALAELGYHCVILWHIDDVKGLRPDLTDEQCVEVLMQCRDRHDATIGVNWDVIRFHADDLFPEGVP
jgi:hypothetical protein